MKNRTILKITSGLVILFLILTVYSVMVPVIATPSEADVINTKEVGTTNVAGGDKIFYYNYVYKYNPGYPSPRLWRESYYEMYEYDTTTDTSTYLGNGMPISASQDYLAYRYYYYKYWYTNFTRTYFNLYYVLDLNTYVPTLWNDASFGMPTDIYNEKMSSTLITSVKPAYKIDIYVTDLSLSPIMPVMMYTVSPTTTFLVKFDMVHINQKYICWTEANYNVPLPPATYPQINNWPIKMLALSNPMGTPAVIHSTSTTYLSRTVRFGKESWLKTMDDNTAVWREYDLTTRIEEGKYINLNTLLKTTYISTRVGSVNLVGDLLYFDVYNYATRKSEIHEYDLTTNAVVNTGIIGYLERNGNGAGDFILSMRTSESQYGADLNGDKDTSDYVIRYLYMTILATIDIDPDTLNLHSNGRWITAYIDLPVGFDVNDILISTVILDKTIKAEWGDVQGTTLMVKFDRLDVENLIGSPQVSVELTVEGKLSSGLVFMGKDSIQSINP